MENETMSLIKISKENLSLIKDADYSMIGKYIGSNDRIYKQNQYFFEVDYGGKIFDNDINFLLEMFDKDDVFIKKIISTN
jgi:hypothetical protein